MNAVIAIDSFKGSLTSLQAGEAAARGIRRACPDAHIRVFPLADGGEGTAEAIVFGAGGQMRRVRVSDPLGRPIQAFYGVIHGEKTAVIEMACAAGLPLLSQSERNPLRTTTYGVGELIRHAVEHGCRDFIVGIGGSATNDGGVGMLSALGVRFLDRNGNPVAQGAQGLFDLAKIDVSDMLPALRDCRFSVACDVKNPLCGESGCSAVYGPQKGATPDMVADMDTALARYAALTREIFPEADDTRKGCGAAGGMGFAFLSYLNAELRSGIAIVMEAIGPEEHVKDADIVITGEGRMDGQSSMGKAPVGVAGLAKKYGKPVVALAGGVTADAVRCHDYGIDAVFSILRAPCTLAEAMDTARAEENLAATAEQVIRLFSAR
ncbi:MAG: glycerate kinase [Clostridia bacterium]|nr:glycerate kinase [Clostridia bacterium]